MVTYQIAPSPHLGFSEPGTQHLYRQTTGAWPFRILRRVAPSPWQDDQDHPNTRSVSGYEASPSGRPLKPSTVLAFAPLPLGNVEMVTDSMGLTAMLTPYLLVIVSTTPIAQTQHQVCPTEGSRSA